MMTNTQIKELFFQQWDAYASGIIEDSDLNSIFNKASLSIFKKLYNNLDLDNSYTTELAPLLKSTTISNSTATINLNQDLLASNPYEKLINVTVTYVDGSKVYTNKVAQPLNDAEVISPYSQGTYRYPRYRYSSTPTSGFTGNESVITIYPTTNITSKTIRYFRDYIPFEFGVGGFDAATCPYGNKTIQMLLDEALKLAGNAYREAQFFQTQSAVQTLDNNNL